MFVDPGCLLLSEKIDLKFSLPENISHEKYQKKKSQELLKF